MTETTNWAEEVGQRIRTARKSQNWGRAELSMRVYAEHGAVLSQDSIGDMERGEKKQIDVRTLKQLADTLNVTLDALLPPDWGNDGGNSGGTVGGDDPGYLRTPREGLLAAA